MFPTGLVAGSGWASGLNLWAVVAALGIAGRAGWANTPAPLQHLPVLIVAVLLYAAEFVIDKIPYVDSMWDIINTAVRPVGAGVLAIALTPHASWSHQLGAVIGSSGAALTSHSAKASLRALINVSPEPVSNILASVGEDGIAFSVVGLALAHPRVAFVVTIVAAFACIGVVWVVARTLKRLGRRLRESIRFRRPMMNAAR